MLTVKFIEERKDELVCRLALKGFQAGDIVDQLLAAEVLRKKLQIQVDTLKAELNTLSKEVGLLATSEREDAVRSAKQKIAGMKEHVAALVGEQETTIQKQRELLLLLPNVPHQSVPKGTTAADNLVVRSGGVIPELNESALPHWELAKKFNLIDFELGVKLTGSGFPVYKDKGARLQRALINFFLDRAITAGYRELIPPLMVNEDSAFGTGQLPDKEGQMYHTGMDNFYLIPTSEVPVTNIYRDEILELADFPVKMTAYTPCFRREAGSYGKDVRGLNRLHQFDKVEIVRIEHPERSYQALDEMVAYVESLVQQLELPYRIVKLCGGDMSFASALTYDFEVYSAAQKMWLEVSSVSNFESFQSNRLKLRYRDKQNKKPQLAHTLNGSALALPRIVAALLENGQTNNGILLPNVLHPFTGFSTIN